ncbi:phosphonatase-like hydrolase [Streptomyces sp. 549]|uniref:phosphonatase-like hydrolase n=1 Tax=Streptomyces sp. 549 TaxID=3049076 RepID=UPI0024C2BE95|nr:phosphonatase-like hydrolase [Streptomyces sp. 549]MDK1473762.1 phosphonatase-like hydrolase [Streptomyces sp. 549]
MSGTHTPNIRRDTGGSVRGTAVRLVVLDMAGTTVTDDGLVERAFAAALPGHDAQQLDLVRRTMGESKITVFRRLLDGDEQAARQANTAFERACAELVADGACTALPGAEEAVRRLRGQGRAVVLTTGFSRTTQDAVLTALGWHDLADLTLCPADAGRGRPHPDLVLTALLRTAAADDVRQVAVSGDTAADMRTGVRAGASVVAGVLTGAHRAPALRDAGATHVLGSVAELPDLLTALD